MGEGMGRVRVDERWDGAGGRRVRSLETGRENPDRRTVVIVPGLGALGYLFDTLAGCGSWARSFLLDVPGFGRRPPWSCAPELPAVTELVTRWLESVPAGPVVLAGHSTGAQVALRVAAERSDLVRALVLLGPTFPPKLRTGPGLIVPYLRTTRHEPAGLLPATMPYYGRAGLKALARFVRTAQEDEPEKLVPAVSCPMVVARGVHDAFSPQAWADRLATAAADGRSVTVPGAHAFPYQHGGLTAALINGAAKRAGIL
ncbi:alpha/beta hydrolase [Nonomuraea sp. 3-1Str]|uniref:alpha/beta fold hydrolase n=1 Tax=Nonomuraea sp. 3-1Str TaxID=2929801 RepID=UPI0028621947|nr:alpha/beta hydrolase [Nonomuraea sp. 3-1Str]MDR8407274.1 alpha/beta hydrolase [Nonomuraea sp. 3-1Str]